MDCSVLHRQSALTEQTAYNECNVLSTAWCVNDGRSSARIAAAAAAAVELWWQ